MTKPDPLLELISGLSGPERAYFMKQSATFKRGEKAYIELFDHLSRHPEMDMKGVRKALGYEDARRFAVAKHELGALLLKSLRDFQAGGHPRMQLNQRLDQVLLLLERGLVTQAHRQLRGLKKQAQRLAEFWVMGEVLQLERRIAKSGGNPKMAAELGKIQDEMNANLKAIHEVVVLEGLRDQLYVLISSRTQFQNEDIKTRIAQIADHPAQRAGCPEGNFHAAMNYFSIRVMICRLKGDLTGMQRQLALSLAQWQGSPQLRKAYAHRHFTQLTTYLDCCLHNGDFAAYKAAVPELENTRPGKGISPELIFQTQMHLALRYALNLPAPELTRSLQKQLKDHLQQLGPKMMPAFQFSLRHNMLCLLFLNGHYADCRYWINSILALESTAFRQDVRHACRIVSMVLYYETGEEAAFEYEIARSVRFFQRKGVWFRFEKAIVGLLRAMFRDSASPNPEFFAAAHASLRKPEFEGLIFHGEICQWLETKAAQAS